METKKNEISNFLAHEYLSNLQLFDDKRAIIQSDVTGALVIGLDDCKTNYFSPNFLVKIQEVLETFEVSLKDLTVSEELVIALGYNGSIEKWEKS